MRWELFDVLGCPNSLNSYAEELWVFTMYNFQDQDRASDSVRLNFDMLSGELLSFVIA